MTFLSRYSDLGYFRKVRGSLARLSAAASGSFIEHHCIVCIAGAFLGKCRRIYCEKVDFSSIKYASLIESSIRLKEDTRRMSTSCFWSLYERVITSCVLS